jgi:hypothetical protein
MRKRTQGVWAPAGLLLAAACLARGDLVETAAGRRVDGRVVALSADGVQPASGAAVAWADVRRVVFDRPPVFDSGARLRLRDGTSLAGVARRLTRDAVVFRPAAAGGEMTVPMDRVAALQLAAGAALEAVRGADATNPVVVLRSGLVRSGGLVASSANNVLLKTPDGLEKFPLENLAGIVFGPVPPAAGPAVVLRNGDRLCGPPQWTGAGARMDVAGTTVAVGLEALAEIRR